MKRSGQRHIFNKNVGHENDHNVINSYLAFFIFRFSITALLQLGVSQLSRCNLSIHKINLSCESTVLYGAVEHQMFYKRRDAICIIYKRGDATCIINNEVAQPL